MRRPERGTGARWSARRSSTSTTGLIGDDWIARGSPARPTGRANPDRQLTIMSVRVLAAIEPDESRWLLAGDQLLVDLDLSGASPRRAPGSGSARRRVVISETPYTGCAKFSGRFGSDALRWINRRWDGPCGAA